MSKIALLFAGALLGAFGALTAVHAGTALAEGPLSLTTPPRSPTLPPVTFPAPMLQTGTVTITCPPILPNSQPQTLSNGWVAYWYGNNGPVKFVGINIFSIPNQTAPGISCDYGIDTGAGVSSFQGEVLATVPSGAKDCRTTSPNTAVCTVPLTVVPPVR